MPAANNIAEYLKEKRAKSGASQESLADQLREYSELFDGVDFLTISRWERGKVSPSIARQIEIIEFFGEQPEQLLGDPDFELRQLPSLAGLQKLMSQNMVYNHVMGGHPYVLHGEHSFDRLNYDSDVSDTYLSQVCDYHQNLTRGREQWVPERLSELLSGPGSELVLYLSGETLVGHVLSLRVGDRIFEQLLTAAIDEATLEREQLLKDDAEAGNLYIQSMYVGSQKICEDALTQIVWSLLNHTGNKALGYRAWANFGGRFMDLIAGEAVGKGALVDGDRSGARYLGKHFSYVAYRVLREQLLGSPTILNLMRRAAPHESA